MSDIQVSVCLITYNHSAYIREAIESVLMQQVNFSWEIIIADDCSTDDTRTIIEEYRTKYPQLIKTLFQPHNVGGGKNFVDLLNAANGKYIAYLEGDDYWIDKHKLQKQYVYMERNSNISLCYHQSNRVYTKLTPWALKNQDKGPNYTSNDSDEPITTINTLLDKGWFILSNTMFFKNIKLPTGFEYLHIGDFPLHVLLADKGDIGFIKEIMGVYRINHLGLSTTTINVVNLEQRKKLFFNEISMYDFINYETRFKYDFIIQVKIYNVFWGYLMFLLKSNSLRFYYPIFYILKKYGFYFFLKHTFKKMKMNLTVLLC